MSTLRTDMIQTTDSLVTVSVSAIASTTDLANTSDPTKGAALIGYKGRTLAQHENDVVNLKDFGAVGDGVADDAPALRAAVAATPTGGTLFIPAGIYHMNSATNNAIIDTTSFPNKSITIQGVGWTLKTNGSFSFGGDFTAGPRGSIFRMGAAIGSTVDFWRQAPTDLTVGGVAFKDFAVTSNTGAYGTPFGRHGFNFDGTANIDGYFENTLMENVFVDNMATGYSVNISSAGNAHGVNAGMVIRNCKLMNINAPSWGDSNTIEYCTFGANATLDSRNIGVYFYNVSGATNIRIINNNFVNANGMIICDGATKPIFDGNEMEQSLVNSAGIMLWMRGNNALIDCPTIVNNSISQNVSGQTYTPIFIATSDSARVSNNRTATPTDYPHLQIANTSSFTLVEADNQAWVLNTPQGAMSTLDAGVKSLLRGQPWKTYTPTITASIGTFTTVTGTGTFQLRDTKTLVFSVDIDIVNAGTAAGSLRVPLPAGFSAKTLQVAYGQEVNATARTVAGNIPAASSTFSVAQYDGTTIIATGRRVVFTGTIEVN